MRQQGFNSEKKKTVMLYGITVFFSMLRLALFLTLPLYALGNAAHDDMQQAVAADYLYRGLWLGPYGNLTLVKGISYPLFLAIARRLMMPSSMLLFIFFAAAAFLFVHALRDEIKSPALRAFLYLVLLYAPPGFDGDTAQRVYRNVLAYPAVLLVCAALTGLYFAVKHGRKKLWWLLLTGLSFTFFYYLREDGIYLMPLFVCGLLYCYISGIVRDRGRLFVRLPQLLLPILIFALLTVSLKTINLRNYGAFVTNDRTQGNFAAVSKDLLMIEEGRRYAYGQIRDPEAHRDPTDFWVSDETILAAMEVSPAFASVKEEVFARRGEWDTLDEGVPGDIFTWALRDAFADAGYFADGAALQDFCGQIHAEITQGFRDGRITRAKGLYVSSSSPGITAPALPSVLKEAAGNLWRLGTYPKAAPKVRAGLGTPAQIRFLETVSGLHAIYPEGIVAEGEDYALHAYGAPVKLAGLFIGIYRIFSYILLPLGTAAFLWNLVSAIRKRKWERAGYAVLAAGFLLTAFAQSFGITLFTQWLPNDDIFYYGSGAAALLFAFMTVSFAGIFRDIEDWKKAKSVLHTEERK